MAIKLPLCVRPRLFTKTSPLVLQVCYFCCEGFLEKKFHMLISQQMRILLFLERAQSVQNSLNEANLF